jgi:hypothetical protein
MTPGLAELVETFQLACHVCGKPDPDAVEDEAALAGLLNPRPIPHPAAIVPPFGVRRIEQAEVERVKPVHARCRPGWRPPQRRDGGGYDIMRSVA